MSDDMALVREFAARQSEPAFAALVERHIGLVHSAALRQVGVAHEVRPVDIDEAVRPGEAPSTYVLRPAEAKAEEDLIASLAEGVGPGITVLVKGSRSNRLERVAAALGAGGGEGH